MPTTSKTDTAEALKLADALDAQVEIGGGDLEELVQASEKLRSLVAEVERLRVQHMPNTVPIPESAVQAAGMVLVGEAWLREHAPGRLRSQPAAPAVAAVPEGWKLVPVEPTDEMRAAFHAVTDSTGLRLGCAGSRWAAMLSAAPTAPDQAAAGEAPSGAEA